MGLFGKKNREEYKSNGLMTSFDQMQYIIVKERSDDELYRICDLILNGKPVLANFDSIIPGDCNYMLAFISGVVYAEAGEVIQLGDRLFLFARAQEFEDGSLKQYVEDNK